MESPQGWNPNTSLLLSEELLQVMKDGLKAQGWIDFEELTNLKAKQAKELNDFSTEIEKLNTKIIQMREVLLNTRLTLMDAYQKGSSLSAHGCAQIAAGIEAELDKLEKG